MINRGLCRMRVQRRSTVNCDRRTEMIKNRIARPGHLAGRSLRPPVLSLHLSVRLLSLTVLLSGLLTGLSSTTALANQPNGIQKIGVQQRPWQDPTRDRTLLTTLMYPTEAEPDQMLADNIAFYGFKARVDARVKSGQWPLYLLLHGTSGNWKNQSWLATRLVQQGAIVVIANHPGYTTGDAEPAHLIRPWHQPLDTSFILDRLLSGPFSEVIDPAKITVIGHSLGGYSALALAGVRFNMRAYQAFCQQHNDKSCQYFAPAFSGLTADDDAVIAADYRDQRVSHAVAITPGFVPARVKSSLNDLSASILVLGAEWDHHVPASTQIEPYVRDQTASGIHYQLISGAGHFSFLQACKPGAVAILQQENAGFVCQPPGKRDRIRIHDEVFDRIQQHTRSSPRKQDVDREG